MRKSIWGAATVATGAVLTCSTAFGQSWATGPSHYDNRPYVAPSFTYTTTQHSRGTDNGLGVALAIGKRVTPFLDLELVGSWTHYSVNKGAFVGMSGSQPDSTRLVGYGAGFNLYAFTGLNDLISGWGAPGIGGIFRHVYLHLDAMHGVANGQPGAGSHHYSGTLFDGGAGINIPLSLPFTRGWSVGSGTLLRVQALYRLDRHGNHDTGLSPPTNNYDEMVYSIGLRIPIGANPADARAEAAPAPTPRVVPVAQVQPAPPPPPPVCQPPAPGQPIDLEGCQVGQTIVLHGVNFEFNKATLTLNAKTILDQVAGALNARQDIQVEIDGYTDGIGSAKYNLGLSQRRADAVKHYLVQHGIASSRITTKGYGKAHPIATNKTDAGRARNRRVELKITAGGSAGSSTMPAGTPPSSGPPASSAPEPSATPPETEAPAAASPTESPIGGAPSAGGAPAGGAPAGGTPAGGAPSGGAPAGGAPPGGAPAGGAPPGGAPAGGAPPGGAPAGGAPAGGAPAGAAPAGGAPPL